MINTAVQITGQQTKAQICGIRGRQNETGCSGDSIARGNYDTVKVHTHCANEDIILAKLYQTALRFFVWSKFGHRKSFHRYGVDRQIG